MMRLTQDEFWKTITPKQAKSALWYYDVFHGVPSPAIVGFESLLYQAGYLGTPTPQSNQAGAWAYAFRHLFERDLNKFRELAEKEQGQ